MITKSVTARAVSRTRPIVNHGVLQSEEPMYQIRHGSHLKAPISVTPSLPHGHFKHALAPRSPANLPVGHEVQDVLPASDANVPMFQSVCVCVCLMWEELYGVRTQRASITFCGPVCIVRQHTSSFTRNTKSTLRVIPDVVG